MNDDAKQLKLHLYHLHSPWMVSQLVAKDNGDVEISFRYTFIHKEIKKKTALKFKDLTDAHIVKFKLRLVCKKRGHP